MKSFVMVAVVVLFVCLLGLNIYFKANVIKAYKFLTNQNVNVTVGQLISKKRLDQEIIPHYPKHKDALLSLASKFRFCITYALTIIIVIAILGLSLLFI